MASNETACINKQKGIALLLFVMFLSITAIAIFLTGFSPHEIKHHQSVSTSKVLNQAKQALIAYAVTYGDIDANNDGAADFPGQYGFLPCPDYNDGALSEGLEDNGNCGAQYVSKIGFFPWKTLGLSDLKDKSGTCLLYAVSGDYKNDESSPPSFKSSMLNEDSNGMFQVVDEAGAIIEGVNPENRIVAIVFAAGEVLPGKSRSNKAGELCGGDYANYAAYLDAGGTADNSNLATTPDMIDQFIHATADSTSPENPNPYNDRFVTISREDIWKAFVNRTDFDHKMTNLTEALAMCLSNYAAVNGFNRLPWPAQLDLDEYQQNSSYADNTGPASGYAGRFPFNVAKSNSDIGVVGSAELFTVATCNALIVSSEDEIDLQTAGSEYRKLWDNWKDHFFYVVSQGYSPAKNDASCSSGCITVNGTTRAGMVIFGKKPEPGQIRNGPVAGDIDTKLNVANYLEYGNEAVFPDNDGKGFYSIPVDAPGTDIMSCLTAAAPLKKTPC